MNTMKRVSTAAAMGLLATAALEAAPATAAPSNSTFRFPVECVRPDGTTFGGVAVAGSMSRGVTVFLDGRPIVAKHIAGTFVGTLTVDDSVVTTFTQPFVQSVGKGVDPARLTTCAFAQTFTEDLVLTTRDIADYQLPASLLGTEATFTGGLVDGVVQVLGPTR